jgi:hypothetical protein
MSRSLGQILARIYGVPRTRSLSPDQRREQSERARKIVVRKKLWERGRIGWVEDQIHSALLAANGDPVSTSDLVRWVYFGARWSIPDFSKRVEAELPAEFVRMAVYPPLMVWDKQLKRMVKPKIRPWHLRQIGKSARTFGRCVARNKHLAKLRVLRTKPDGSSFYYSEVRKEKAKRYAKRKTRLMASLNTVSLLH